MLKVEMVDKVESCGKILILGRQIKNNFLMQIL